MKDKHNNLYPVTRPTPIHSPVLVTRECYVITTLSSEQIIFELDLVEFAVEICNHYSDMSYRFDV